MKKSLIISLFFLAYLAPNTVFAQYSKLAGFDDKLIHFGFALSYNNADFYIQRSIEHQFADDSLQSLVVASKPGFTLGVISSLNLPAFMAAAVFACDAAANASCSWRLISNFLAIFSAVTPI